MKINKALIKGSTILLLSFGFYNFLNFLFHISMARLLSVVNYGILATLISVVYIFGVFSESIQTILSKYSATENDKGKIKNIIKRSAKKASTISVLFFVLFLIASLFLSPLLKLSYWLLALGGVMIFFAFFTPVSRGIMQGKRMFRSLGINVVTESSLKLILSILMIYLGFEVFGVVAGIILASLVAFLFSLLSLSQFLKAEEKHAKISEIYNYTKSSFVIILVILIFYSLDILIAKIVFSEEIAGAYAILSMLAKIIFYGTQPITKTMFPLSVENQKNKKESENVLINSLVMIILLASAALFVYYIAPDLIINIFSGKTLEISSRILFLLGIGTSIISVTSLVLFYKISIGKTRGYPYLISFIFIEIILLTYFSGDLYQFAIAFIASAAAFLTGSVFLIGNDKNKR